MKNSRSRDSEVATRASVCLSRGLPVYVQLWLALVPPVLEYKHVLPHAHQAEIAKTIQTTVQVKTGYSSRTPDCHGNREQAPGQSVLAWRALNATSKCQGERLHPTVVTLNVILIVIGVF